MQQVVRREAAELAIQSGVVPAPAPNDYGYHVAGQDGHVQRYYESHLKMASGSVNTFNDHKELNLRSIMIVRACGFGKPARSWQQELKTSVIVFELQYSRFAHPSTDFKTR